MIAKPVSVCQGCPLYGSGMGFVTSDGTGSSGVLMLLEAGGQSESESGLPVCGKSGHFLFNQLKRVGLDREVFKIDNCCKCQPPSNKLAGMYYEESAINHCRPLLDPTITEMQELCKRTGKTFTILTLGKTAFKRALGINDKHPLLKVDYYNYPIWSDATRAWVIAAPHPSFLMRANTHLVPLLQFAATRAIEIASNGFQYDTPMIMCDPEAATFQQWIETYEHALKVDPAITLAFDIETPYKQGADEAEVAKEDDEDYTILRCSFAYKEDEGVSIPWRGEYKPLLERLFASKGPKVGHNSDQYDLPRILHQMPVEGDHHDTMLMWHVLNSAMPKGLGFITPYFWQAVAPWKHTSDTEPAKYNALDSIATLRCFNGIKTGLKQENLWRVYDRHVVELNRVLHYMSDKGVLRDETLRNTLETRLSGRLDAVEQQMETAIPVEARRLKVYRKTPKDLTGMIPVEKEGMIKRCSLCNELSPKKAHFKPAGKKAQKADISNPCETGIVIVRPEKVQLWAKPLAWKVSKLGLTSYQQVRRHQAVVDRRDGKTTFDSNAIEALIKKYPSDPLYKLIVEHRTQQKLLTVYVGKRQLDGSVRGGLTIGKDGRIHPVYTHNPSTLRLACQSPNAQQIPSRTKEGREIRDLLIASEGCQLVELDFSAIEAVLVGYFATDPSYIRLAKMGIHSYLASFVLNRPADLKWSDSDLEAYFKEIKKSKDEHTQNVYQGCKRAVHLSGYGGSPKKMVIAEPDIFLTVAYAAKLQGMYFELFPLMRKWQIATQLQADRDGYLRNPFNYIHRFSRIFNYEKIGTKWERHPSEDANRALAFLPQSTAAGIIKESMLRLFNNRFEEAGQYLRLQVHDSLVNEIPTDKVDQVLPIIREEMTKPVPELRLPTSYNMGESLAIGVEAKVGTRWGSLT